MYDNAHTVEIYATMETELRLGRNRFTEQTVRSD